MPRRGTGCRQRNGHFAGIFVAGDGAVFCFSVLCVTDRALVAQVLPVCYVLVDGASVLHSLVLVLGEPVSLVSSALPVSLTVRSSHR